MNTKFEFKNHDGVTLAGALEEPTVPRRGVAVFAHCFTCHKNVHAASRVSKGLRDQGFAVLRFDFTGLGQSEGDFANTNFSTNLYGRAGNLHFDDVANVCQTQRVRN